MLMLCFLAAMEMKPLTLWACQSVAFMISARVAPLARPIIAMILAPLLSARGALASLLRAGLVLAPLAAFSPLGAPPFLVAPFFEGAFSGATGAPCSATAAAWVVSVAWLFFMVFNPFYSGACASSRTTIHHSV